MNTKKRNLLYLSILLLVVLIIGGSFLLSSKNVVIVNPVQPIINDTTTPQEETVDWEPYTNEEYKYSFKYPADKFSDPSPFRNLGNPVSLNSHDLSGDSSGNLISGMDIIIYVYEDSSIEEAYKKATSVTNYTSSTKESVKFKNFTAEKYTGSSNKDMYRGLIFKKDELIFSFYIRYSANEEDADNIFDKISSTLEFMNQE